MNGLQIFHVCAARFLVWNPMVNLEITLKLFAANRALSTKLQKERPSLAAVSERPAHRILSCRV